MFVSNGGQDFNSCYSLKYSEVLSGLNGAWLLMLWYSSSLEYQRACGLTWEKLGFHGIASIYIQIIYTRI